MKRIQASAPNASSVIEAKTINSPLVRPTTSSGVPRTRLLASQPSGAKSHTMTPDHATFEKQRKVASIPSHPVPEELQCPICRKLMKDAVLVACCGASYCDGCIRQEDPTETMIDCPLCKR